ncbi:DUF6492 family protein [Arthrobacter sp. NQ4]|uniref:DUF6492 family protein n=1 Tax=Arthrobacter sp. NQ4 TaxID=3027930 RepID=UPI0023B14276|nr:DUF6492 family protein [Arthrobacter sp. NQ4]MDE8588526.1 DUF6492 family protein [Arthrobacter sp. NQ4]
MKDHQRIPTLAVVTPSYRPDFELCRDLNSSILRFTYSDVEQYIIVPESDRKLFSTLAGSRTHIQDVREYLPGSIIKLPRTNMWINARRPLPPIRGWIAQQIVKLGAAAAMTTDVVVLVDSDVVLIRPMSSQTFMQHGQLALYEVAGGIDSSLPRHRLWYATARRLLGLPSMESPELPDYICCPCAWSPALVRSMLGRIESVTGTDWVSAVGKELHFSEMILYGVYVRDVLNSSHVPSSSTMHCLNHYEEEPLNEDALRLLLSTATPLDFAVMVSAKSGTQLQTRRAVLSSFTART